MSEAEAVLKVLGALSDKAATRLKTITVGPQGTTLEFFPEGLHSLAGGRLVTVSDNPATNEVLDSLDEEDEGAEGSPLDGDIGATAYVDLMTLVALTEDTGTPWSVGRTALWLQVDPHSLSRYLNGGYYEHGLEAWRQALTADEQRDLKMAIQRIVLANTHGPLEETIKHLSASEETSEEMRKHIVSRWTLNRQVIQYLEAEAGEIPED